MNSLILSIQSPTPPKKKRQSLPVISSKSHNNYSLDLSRHVNPPELSISGPQSQRLNKIKVKQKNRSIDIQPQRTNNYPLSSRRSHDKVTNRKQKVSPNAIFLIRNKNYSHKKKVHLKSLVQQQIFKLKRDFDQYLTYIKSQSNRYTLPKLIKKQVSSVMDILKTIKYIFYKVTQQILSNSSIAKQLCITYLSMYQKIEFQCSLSTHIKLSAINKLFIVQRLICYYIIILQGSNKFSTYLPLFNKSIYYFCLFSESMMEIVKTSNKVSIQSTLKNTQLVCQIDKICTQILSQLKLLTKPLSRELYQADKQLMLLFHYINEPNFMQRLIKLQLNINWKLFKLPPIPYLPPIQKYECTLILELDTTLTFYDDVDKTLMFRPYLQQFLDSVIDKYQIVLYTISRKQYADKIIDEIDPLNRIFVSRLYHEHISIYNGEYHKDLTKIGRNINKCIIIDSQSNHYRGYEDNVMKISKWYGTQYDQELKNIMKVLKLVEEGQNKIDLKKKVKNKHLLTHISQQPQQTLVSNK